MSYFMRAFCRAGEAPSVASLVHYLESQWLDVHVESSSGAKHEICRQVIFRYKPEKSPLVVDCIWPEPDEDLLGREINEFLETIGPPGISVAKRRVIRHLKQSKFILAIRLPSDVDSAGFQISDAILRYCKDHCKALIQADGEGFYQGTKLILSLQQRSSASTRNLDKEI